MRGQYNRDSYLWVKEVLPNEDVWKTRETHFEYLPYLAKENTPARGDVFCGDDWRLVNTRSEKGFGVTMTFNGSGCSLESSATCSVSRTRIRNTSNAW